MLIEWENLPRKTMSSGALFLNKEGKFIITNPNYKEGWNVPGGMVDPNESPAEAFKREVKEEALFWAVEARGVEPRRP
jgi:ADP-ribose pyrophosphatase YjhB (NUDIX family)